MNDFDFEYELHSMFGHRKKVAGKQIGYFAIRESKPSLAFHVKTGRLFMASGGFIIDHWPSGTSVIAAPTMEAAIVIADDLNIRPGRPIDAETPEGAMAQVGDEVNRWIDYITATRNHISFREWKEAKGD